MALLKNGAKYGFEFSFREVQKPVKLLNSHWTEKILRSETKRINNFEMNSKRNVTSKKKIAKKP